MLPFRLIKYSKLERDSANINQLTSWWRKSVERFTAIILITADGNDGFSSSSIQHNISGSTMSKFIFCFKHENISHRVTPCPSYLYVIGPIKVLNLKPFTLN